MKKSSSKYIRSFERLNISFEYPDRKIIRAVFLILLIIFCCKTSIAQEIQEKKENFHTHFELALVLGHAHVFQGRDEEGHREVLSLPSWGFDINYWIHPKWAIGLHTDIIIEKFEVKKLGSEGANEDNIERSYPVAPALMGVFKPTDHWKFSLGLGEEFAKEENLFLNRIGVEYSAELPKHWEVFGTISYDIKWNSYDDWVVGIGIAKSFGK